MSVAPLRLLVPGTLNHRVFSLAFRHFSASTARFSGRRYTKKHEWVSVQGEIGTVGISNFAQEALGDVVYAELPEVGTVFSQGDTIGAVESVKAASDVYSPVSGTVTEKNSAVETSPGVINKSPYEKGWLLKLKLKDANELTGLMDETAYDKYLATQENH